MAENIQKEIEDKVIDCINSGVAGRLIIFKPEGAPFGADLAVERRGKYKEKSIYFQINSFVEHGKDNNLVKDFLQESFKVNENFYLLFVYFDEIRQKISDYIWLIPSSQFRDIAQVVKSGPEGYPGKNLLRFEASLDIKNKNKYSKFIVNTKELGELILDALERGGKFNFKEADFQDKQTTNLENLKEFLCDARKNTYSANASSIDNPRLLASTQLEFQKGDYFYRDIFFNGDKKYIGQEIVYQDSKPVWGMNYIGTAQGAPLGKLEAAFLKEALFKLAEKCRLGQSCEYEKREFKYQDQGQGNLEEFLGQEEIFSNGKNIYKLNYQGGLI
jgi:hypothetical protein